MTPRGVMPHYNRWMIVVASLVMVHYITTSCGESKTLKRVRRRFNKTEGYVCLYVPEDRTIFSHRGARRRSPDREEPAENYNRQLRRSSPNLSTPEMNSYRSQVNEDSSGRLNRNSVASLGKSQKLTDNAEDINKNEHDENGNHLMNKNNLAPDRTHQREGYVVSSRYQPLPSYNAANRQNRSWTKDPMRQQFPLLRRNLGVLVQVSMYVSELQPREDSSLSVLAGEAQLKADKLSRGMHNLTFRVVQSTGQLVLHVLLDGVRCPLMADTISREYIASAYRLDLIAIDVKRPVLFVPTCQAPTVYTESSLIPNSDRGISFPGAQKPVHIPSDEPNVDDPHNYSVLSNVVIKNKSISKMILQNVTLIDSDVNYSFINNSNMENSLISNSIVFVATMSNSTIVNSTLHNVTLIGCKIDNNMMIHSSIDSSTIASNNSFHNNHHRDATLTLDFADSSTLDSADINATMMLFGILGMIVLVAAVVVVGLLVVRFTLKKRRDMSLVRSAVMGNVKSW